SACELDDLQAALDVALGVGDDLAVLGCEQFGEAVDVLLDQLLEPEHDSRTALRIRRRPAGQSGVGGVDRRLQIGGGAELYPCLDRALVGVENIAFAVT